MWVGPLLPHTYVCLSGLDEAEDVCESHAEERLPPWRGTMRTTESERARDYIVHVHREQSHSGVESRCRAL